MTIQRDRLLGRISALVLLGTTLSVGLARVGTTVTTHTQVAAPAPNVKHGPGGGIILVQ